MANNRTPAQAAIARRIAIRNRIIAARQNKAGLEVKPISKSVANCIAASGFAEHASYYA